MNISLFILKMRKISTCEVIQFSNSLGEGSKKSENNQARQAAYSFRLFPPGSCLLPRVWWENCEAACSAEGPAQNKYLTAFNSLTLPTQPSIICPGFWPHLYFLPHSTLPFNPTKFLMPCQHAMLIVNATSHHFNAYCPLYDAECIYLSGTLQALLPPKPCSVLHKPILPFSALCYCKCPYHSF